MHWEALLEAAAQRLASNSVGNGAYCVTITKEDVDMTLCPIAIVAGCQKCPAFKVCPLKDVIGDSPKPGASTPEAKKAMPKAKK